MTILVLLDKLLRCPTFNFSPQDSSLRNCTLPNRLSYQALEPRFLLATLFAESFESFAGNGFSHSPGTGQLDSGDWRATGLSDGDGSFGGIHTGGDFSRGLANGSVTSGGVYAFTVGGGNRVFGAQQTGGDLTPGTFGLRVANTTGSTVHQWSISYDVWFHNDESRSSAVKLSYSTDDSNYMPVSALDFATPLASDNNGWTSTARQSDIGVSVPVGGFLYFKWDLLDAGGSGGRDEIGIDEVTISTDGSGGSNPGGSVGGVDSFDLRVVSYNVANNPLTNGEETDFQTIFSAIGQETVAGVQRDIDLLVLQETEPESLDRIESIMDGLYSQNYTQIISENHSGDYFGYLYNSETLSVLEVESLNGSYTRDPLRAKFRPVGAGNGSADFHVFNVHLNATSASTRQSEANGIRGALNSLGSTENFMVIGDLNIDSSSEGSYSTLTASGSGQVQDPINSPGFWHNNNSFKSIHTQNPAGQMDDRFDFQLLNDDAMNAGGLEYIPGSYRAFGNDGSHTIDQPITSGSGAPSTVLSALADASDHLPVVVDFRYDIAAINTAEMFYNNSEFDVSSDLDAVTPKSHLSFGETATFDNYSSYSKGINGLVLEVQEFATTPTLANISNLFDFKQGNSNDVSSWGDAVDPTGVAYEADIDASGHDRIFLTWNDETIKNTWLEVTALSNSSTGLMEPISFYFGNAIGETGNDSANAQVNLADVGLTRANQTGFGSAELENLYDFDRNGAVNLGDVGLARANQSGFSPLQLITPGTSNRASGFSGVDIGTNGSVSSNHFRIAAIGYELGANVESESDSGLKTSFTRKNTIDQVFSDLSLDGATEAVLDRKYDKDRISKPTSARGKTLDIQHLPNLAGSDDSTFDSISVDFPFYDAIQHRTGNVQA